MGWEVGGGFGGCGGEVIGEDEVGEEGVVERSAIFGCGSLGAVLGSDAPEVVVFFAFGGLGESGFFFVFEAHTFHDQELPVLGDGVGEVVGEVHEAESGILGLKDFEEGGFTFESGPDGVADLAVADKDHADVIGGGDLEGGGAFSEAKHLEHIGDRESREPSAGLVVFAEDEGVDEFADLFEVKGLLEDLQASEGMGLIADLFDVEGGDDDELGFGVFGGGPTKQIHAAHFGEVEVGDKDGDGLFADDLLGDLGVGSE